MVQRLPNIILKHHVIWFLSIEQQFSWVDESMHIAFLESSRFRLIGQHIGGWFMLFANLKTNVAVCKECKGTH